MKNREYSRPSISGGIRKKNVPALKGSRSEHKNLVQENPPSGKRSTRPEKRYRPGKKTGYKGSEKAAGSYYTREKGGPGGRKEFNEHFRRGGKSIGGTSRKKPAGNDDGMRLNRYLAHSGIGSRRQADELIRAGLVSVNGVVVREMGVKIKQDDVVKYNGESIRSEKKVYILLNKPKDYVTSLEDEKGRRTVTDLIRGACRERVYPVGRLDRNTTGVMLLTNDGELSAKLSHPRYNKKKIYHVHLDKTLKPVDLKTISNGIELEDGPIVPDAITYITGRKRNEAGIEIHSGRNRIVKRIFESLGYKVVRLDRVYFAGLTKKNLPRGKWRFLEEKEINMLKMNAYD